MKAVKFWITTLLLCGAILRLLPLNFPAFTADEARISQRAYSLATEGKDELGRTFPLIFNSLTDYQLPLVSYLSVPGMILFGKSDFGARSLFILAGVAMIFLAYKTAGLISAFFIAFSPSLIFLSKVPNETIILVFLIMLLLFLVKDKKINLPLFLTMVILTFLTSKIAWFIVPAFLFLTKKPKMGMLTLIFSAAVLLIFLNIPQGKRSLTENNFPIFQDQAITSSINQLRGQDQKIIWPHPLERLLFNKSHIFLAGFLHWISGTAPVVYFGQFDMDGLKGFMSMGAFPKAAVIPFALGLVFIVRNKDRKFIALFWYILLFSAPLLFLYPSDGKDLIVLTLPFMSVIMALGMIKLNNFFKFAIITLAVLEVIVNIFFLSPEIKNANSIRPGWIREITDEAFKLSRRDKVAISDNLVSDIAPFIKWFTPKEEKEYFSDIHFPYKFRQTNIANIKIIGSEDSFYKCGLDAPTYIIASKRDFKKIHYFLNIVPSETITKTYFDSLGEETAYLLERVICVK